MRLQVDLTVVVVRDDADGFIGWHQDEQGRDRHGVDLTNPDLCALAESFGGDRSADGDLRRARVGRRPGPRRAGSAPHRLPDRRPDQRDAVI